MMGLGTMLAGFLLSMVSHAGNFDPDHLVWRSGLGQELWLRAGQLILHNSEGRVVHRFTDAPHYYEGTVASGRDLEVRAAQLADGTPVGLIRWNGEFRVVGRRLDFFVGPAADCLLLKIDDPEHPAAQILSTSTLASLRRESERKEALRSIDHFLAALREHETAAIERARSRTLEFDPIRNPTDQTYRLTSAELLGMGDRLSGFTSPQLSRFRRELEKLTVRIQTTLPGPDAFEISPISDLLLLLGRSSCSALESAA